MGAGDGSLGLKFMEKAEMTAEEEAGLKALGEELEAARRSQWQPRAVARVFGRGPGEGPVRLTMQGWIDLEWVQSPLLEGGYPRSIQEIEEASSVWGRVGGSVAGGDRGAMGG